MIRYVIIESYRNTFLPYILSTWKTEAEAKWEMYRLCTLYENCEVEYFSNHAVIHRQDGNPLTFTIRGIEIT